MKLLELIHSPRPEKKWRAVFVTDTGRRKHTDFGAAGMNDYTITGDREARRRYRERHEKDLDTGDPSKAGFLSWYILWGDSKNMRTNLADFKRRFNLG
jgi:hypothetical protein